MNFDNYILFEFKNIFYFYKEKKQNRSTMYFSYLYRTSLCSSYV